MAWQFLANKIHPGYHGVIIFMGGWGQGCELYCIARANHEMDHEIHQEADRIGELQQLELTTYSKILSLYTL